MKGLILVLGAALLGGVLVLSATEASAFVCPPGVYRAGCVGPPGVGMGHHRYYGGVYPRGAYPGGVYPGGAYPGGGYYRGGASRNIGPNQITPGGATIPGGR
jgi:hypothetical protein